MNRFLCRKKAQTEALVFCFPHAGGSSLAYSGWQKNADPRICFCPAEYPGRGICADDCSEMRWETLAPELADEILREARRSSQRVILLGVSLGALLAFCCAAELERRGYMPDSLVVCAHCAPQEKSGGYHAADGIEALPDELLRLGAVTPEMLNEPGFRQYFLPLIYRDYCFHDAFVYRGEKLARTPVFCFFGTSDPYFTMSSAEGWRAVCTSQIRFAEAEGGHFFAYHNRAFQLSAESLILGSGADSYKLR